MFKSTTKYKNRLYAMMPTIDKSNMGIALVVLEETKKNVKGVKFVVNGHANFKLSVKDFEQLLEYRKISLADEQPPTEVIDELNKIYLAGSRM
jgi:hypothetical protein